MNDILVLVQLDCKYHCTTNSSFKPPPGLLADLCLVSQFLKTAVVFLRRLNYSIDAENPINPFSHCFRIAHKIL